MSFALFIYHIMRIMSFLQELGRSVMKGNQRVLLLEKRFELAKLAVDLQPAIACWVSRIVLWWKHVSGCFVISFPLKHDIPSWTFALTQIF